MRNGAAAAAAAVARTHLSARPDRVAHTRRMRRSAAPEKRTYCVGITRAAVRNGGSAAVV